MWLIDISAVFLIALFTENIGKKFSSSHWRNWWWLFVMVGRFLLISWAILLLADWKIMDDLNQILRQKCSLDHLNANAYIILKVFCMLSNTALNGKARKSFFIDTWRYKNIKSFSQDNYSTNVLKLILSEFFLRIYVLYIANVQKIHCSKQLGETWF